MLPPPSPLWFIYVKLSRVYALLHWPLSLLMVVAIPFLAPGPVSLRCFGKLFSVVVVLFLLGRGRACRRKTQHHHAVLRRNGTRSRCGEGVSELGAL